MQRLLQVPFRCAYCDMTWTAVVCRATLHKLAERQALQDNAPPTAASTLQQHLTHVPRPDRRPECKAHIGLCQSNALWSATNVQLMHHKLQGCTVALDSESNKLKEASVKFLHRDPCVLHFQLCLPWSCGSLHPSMTDQKAKNAEHPLHHTLRFI